MKATANRKKQKKVVELADDEEWVFENNKQGYLDEKYIAAFIEHPELGKTQAILAAGYTGGYAKQEAYRLHKKLLDRIEKELDDKILDGAHVGHSTLVHLCKEAESETVKAKVAKDLIDFAGRKAGERVTVTHELSDEERDEEIIRLTKEIAEQEGTNRKLDS